MTLEMLISKLRKKVEKDGLRETARSLGISPASVHNYLEGKRTPSGSQTMKLLEKLT